MTDEYLYVCSEAHKKKGTFLRNMFEEEIFLFKVLDSKPEFAGMHLGNCQYKGCQFLKAVVIVKPEVNRQKLSDMLKNAIQNLESDRPGEDKQGYNLIKSVIEELK